MHPLGGTTGATAPQRPPEPRPEGSPRRRGQVTARSGCPNSRPMPIVMPPWADVEQVAGNHRAQKREHQSPAVTTVPKAPIDRMIPVLIPAPISSLNRDTSSRVVAAADGHQDDHRERQHDPVQFDADDASGRRRPRCRTRRRARSPPFPRSPSRQPGPGDDQHDDEDQRRAANAAIMVSHLRLPGCRGRWPCR